MSGVVAAAERAAGSSAVMRQALAGWYLLSPRPDPRDILSYRVRPIGTHAEIELTIMRGHYVLLDLLQSHKDLFIREDGSVRCSCHPEETFWILRDQLPNYKGEFSDAQVQQYLETETGNLSSEVAEGAQ